MRYVSISLMHVSCAFNFNTRATCPDFSTRNIGDGTRTRPPAIDSQAYRVTCETDTSSTSARGEATGGREEAMGLQLLRAERVCEDVCLWGEGERERDRRVL